MKNIFVTGATGFVGHSLIRILTENGYFIRATSHNTAPEFIESKNKVVDWINYDLNTNDYNYSTLLEDIDVIVHLAAQVHIVNKNKHGLESFQRTNVLGTKKLAEESANRGVKRFIYISTVKVHGEQTILNDNAQPFTEDDQLLPVSAYAKSKLKAEDSIRKICHESKMDFVILRPTLVYGPGVKANFLSLLDVINKNYPLPLASVKNKRSLLYVNNLAHVISLCVDNPEVANQTYLLSDTDISAPELVRKIAFLLGKRALLFPFPIKYLRAIGFLTGKRQIIESLTDSLLVDNNSICIDAKWVPPYSFDEGLQATVDWYLYR